ncbi:DUF3488 and transglutaminase-like domain-containing protein [Streptosporangium sp. KLBMP 9127]|nr:DUF3488 and transglutaminase-like domain-containing protein [Streptosporangium sp. KLBMP 9127]
MTTGAGGTGGAGPGVRRVLAVLVVVALAGVAGLAFDGVFLLGDLVPVVAVAAAVPAAVSAVLYGRLPLWCSLVVSLLSWTLVVSATLFRAQATAGFLPGPGTLSGAVLGVRDAWKALLTTILPAAPAPGTIVLVHALVWLAALAGAETVLRTGTRVLPVVPAALVFLVASVLGVAGVGSGFPWASALVVGALLLALVRAAGSARTAVAGVVALLVLGPAAGVAGAMIPVAAEPYDVRRHVTPPPARPLQGVSPLDYVSSWLQNPQRPMFTARSGTDANWRLAVLDRFDGAAWSSTGGFLPSQGRVPPSASEGDREEVEQRVTMAGLPGVWLPAADRPRSVSGAAVTVDPVTGVLTSPTPVREGMTYTVTSAVREFSTAELRDAVPTRNPTALELPAAPGGRTAPQVAKFRRLAQDATKGARRPMRQAVLLAEYLRRRAVYDVNSPPGHSYGNLDFFLRQERRGTTEQFAAAFAVLARTLGLPSRVVVGFQPGTVADGERRVLSGDVLAWAEVEFTGLGWVPFYPTPPRGDSAGDGETAEGISERRQQIERQIGSESAESEPTPRPSPSKKPTPRGDPRERDAEPPWPLIAGASGGGLVAVYLLAVLVVPVWRRWRRRRAGTPEARIEGAWRQTTGRLRAVGVPASSSLTAEEVAAIGASALRDPAAGAHLRPLAGLVNLTWFADGGGHPDWAAADTAWEHSAAVDLMVRREVTLPRRIRRRLGPGSLSR